MFGVYGVIPFATKVKEKMRLDETHERYERQIIDPFIGVEGQVKIGAGRIIMIGAGGLGSSVGMYLAAAGVGTIGIVDNDTVSASNFNRQLLYIPEDIGEKKVDIAAERLAKINPGISVKAINVFVDDTNVSDIISDYDIVIDATDNLVSKFILNDACIDARKILIHAGVQGFIGQVMTIVPGSSCLRCFLPTVPSDMYSKDRPRPVIGVAAGLLGQLQAAETLKALIKKGDLLTNSMMFVDLATMSFNKIKVPKNTHCPICG